MARRARLTTGQEVTVDDAGAEALSRAPQFLTWVDDLVDVPKADGTTIKAHRETVKDVLGMPGMAPVVDAPTPPDTRGRTPIKQTDGTTMWVPPEFVDVALRQPSSAGGEAMRKLVDEPRRRAALLTGDVGAWNPPADWARGGAKLRAIEASPREAALERLGSGDGLVLSNPDTGEFSVNTPRNNYVNALGDMGASPKVKPQIGITPDEYSAMAATQEGLAADEAEADRRRQAMLDLVNRTKVPPKPRASRPMMDVQQVGSGGSARAPVDLAALAPAGSMERGSYGAGDTAPSAVATGGVPTSRTPMADELGRLQQQAALSRLGTGISRAGARINEALTGAKPTPGFYEGLDEEAGNQVRDYVQRQGLAQQEGDRARKLEEEAALKDPFSAESKRFRAALEKTLPGVYTPEELSQLTAADAPMVMDFAKMKAALDARKPKMDPNADLERKRLEAQISLIDAQTAATNRRGRGTGTVGGASKEQQKIDAEQRKLAERNVGGFTFDPSNPPTADGAKKMAEAAKARDEILGSLDRLEALFKEHGTEVGGGAAQAEMESERTNIVNRLRVLNEMGVPNGKDYEVIAQQIPELTGLGAMFTRNSTFAPKFNALRGQVARTVDATAKAYKFHPAGQGPQRIAAPTDASGHMDLNAPSASGRIPVKRVPNKDRTKYRIDYSDGTSEVVDA